MKEFKNAATNEELVVVLGEMSKDDKIPFTYRMAAREARNVIIEYVKLSSCVNVIFSQPWEEGDEV